MTAEEGTAEPPDLTWNFYGKLVAKPKLIILEKAWNMTNYEAVEDSGKTEPAEGSTDEARDWYVLWTYDKHRFVLNDPDSQIASASVNGAAMTRDVAGKYFYLDFSNENSCGDTAVTATVTFSGGPSVTLNPIYYSIHEVTGTSWVNIEKCTDDNINGKSGKWAQLSGTAAYQVPGEPGTDGESLFDPYFNEVQVETTISPVISEGRWGTLHYAWFDPGTDDGLPTTSPANRRRNNVPASRGIMAFTNGVTLLFSGVATNDETQKNSIVLKFPLDCYRSDFFVALHPRANETSAYRFNGNGTQVQYIEHLFNGTPLEPQNLPDSMDTSTIQVLSWFGFTFPDEWVFNAEGYTMRTPEPTGTLNGQSASMNPDKLAESILDYEEAFVMNVNFDFVGPTYVIPLKTATEAHSKHPHRSFHRNSGIYIYKLIEVQIYDTAGLIDSPLNHFLTVNLSENAEKPSIEVANLTDGSVQNLNIRNVDNSHFAIKLLENNQAKRAIQQAVWQGNWEWHNGVECSNDSWAENISGCVTGILYHNNFWKSQNFSTLNAIQNRTSVSFTFTPYKETNTYDITGSGIENCMGLGFGTGTSNGLKAFGDHTTNKLYLQNHWGSGVKFQQISITKP